MTNKATYTVNITGLFCKEKVTSMCDWYMFSKEARQEALNWIACKELTVKTILVMNGKYVVLAYGKNF